MWDQLLEDLRPLEVGPARDPRIGGPQDEGAKHCLETHVSRPVAANRIPLNSRSWMTTGFAAASFSGGDPRRCPGRLSVARGSPRGASLLLACQQRQGEIPSQLDGSRHTSTQAPVSAQHCARNAGRGDHPIAVHLHGAADGPGSGSGGRSNPGGGSCPQSRVC